MEKHETKDCPRCGRPLVCRINRIHRCACLEVFINPETAEWISLHYDDCLCTACLRELQQRFADSAR